MKPMFPWSDDLPVPPPRPLPWFLRPLVVLSERIAGRPLLPSRILAWSPRLALVSGLLELAVEGAARSLGSRLVALVRLEASFAAACPFCITMNSQLLDRAGVEPGELEALRQRADPAGIPGLAPLESLVLRHARNLCASPIVMDADLLREVHAALGPRDTVRLAVLVAKVQYFARMAQGLGVPG